MGESPRSQSFNLPTWLKPLFAPLLLISLGLHGVLLLVPAPSGSAGDLQAEEEPVEADDGPVDLLSISSLATPEAELPPEPELPPESVAAPPPEAPPPSAPTQPVVPEVYPDPGLPQEQPVETFDDPPEADDFQSDDPPEAENNQAFEPPPPAEEALVEQQQALQVSTRLVRAAGDSNFDVTDTLFPFGAWPVISQWSGTEQACFFAEISEETFQLAAGAEDIRFLSRNIEFIERDDLPRTFPSPEYQLNRIDQGYCDRTFFEVYKAGQPVLFVSVVGIGPGNPQSTALVIFWSSDPRATGG